MDDLKNLWLRQDAVGRTVSISGLAVSLLLLFLGKGVAGAALMAVMILVCWCYAHMRAKRARQVYGFLTYVLPDGEEVVLPVGDLEKRHVGRTFLLRCPYDGKNSDGDWVTAFGMVLDMSGCEVIPRLRRGEMMCAEGILAEEGSTFYLAVHSCALG